MAPLRPGTVIISIWVAWALSWVAAAGWSSRTQSRPAVGPEIGYRVVMGIGAAIMFTPAHGYEGPLRLWHVGWTGAWLCTALVGVGVAFAWWARLHLGRLWSGRITLKADHKVVDSGPYALVRHPIYTGLLLSLLATAIAEGTIPGVAGFVILLVGIWLKARLEERWLTAQLGEDAYASYRRRVPMLLPFGPSSR
jgi:protein-S-isoprenylcysteine O-methyltransferase Ste14